MIFGSTNVRRRTVSRVIVAEFLRYMPTSSLGGIQTCDRTGTAGAPEQS